MRRVEVRCCCQPFKLLGTLPLPDNARSWSYPVCKASRVTSPQALLRATRGGIRPETVTLELHKFGVVEGGRLVTGWALKADGLPLEKLRRIPGFIEAKPADSDLANIALATPSFQQKGSS